MSLLEQNGKLMTKFFYVCICVTLVTYVTLFLKKKIHQIAVNCNTQLCNSFSLSTFRDQEVLNCLLPLEELLAHA